MITVTLNSQDFTLTDKEAEYLSLAVASAISHPEKVVRSLMTAHCGSMGVRLTAVKPFESHSGLIGREKYYTLLPARKGRTDMQTDC